MSLASKIESLLFVAIKPMSVKKIAELVKADEEKVKESLNSLLNKYNTPTSGINLLKNNQNYQLATGPDNRKLVQDFIKDEMTGELSKPSLETLTIVAYRGPITKPEIEQVRGVNCSLIIRNLMIRGLIEQKEDKKAMKVYYTITFDFMRYLGINDIKELPNYEKLNQSDDLNNILTKQTNDTAISA